MIGEAMKRRVVITGMGAITPIGNSVDEFWAGVRQQKVGIDFITRFDASDYKAKLAAEVKNFDAKNYMDFKMAKRMETFSQYAVAAAGEAIADAGLDMADEDAYMAGTSVSSGIGSLDAMEREHKKLLEKGPSRINPLLVPLMITNMAAGNVAIAFGLKGKSLNVVTACASGTNAVGEGYRSIQSGEADIMVSGGTESAVTPIGIGGFAALTALSASTDPKRASIPFDRDRSGFVMGEGAGIVVLEELEHAKRRNAKIYGEIIGFGATTDAYHITSPCPDGEGGACAMQRALDDAKISANEVDYINAHGTSTHLNDLTETLAIKKVFGNNTDVMISSTKGNTGHLLGAAGAVEAIICTKAMEEGIVPPNINYKEKDEECDLNLVVEDSKKENLNIVLSNSLGFGGHNACIAIKKFED